MPRYAIIKEFPRGFSTFDLPNLLSKPLDKMPPTIDALEMRMAAEDYVDMVEHAEALGLKVEYLSE